MNEKMKFDITLSEYQKEQVFKRLKEATLEKINAICKEKITKDFKSEVLGSLHASMRTNEQEVTATLNANTENIKSEIQKLENQMIETTTRLLTSYQVFLNQARDNANNQITENKTQSLEAIAQAKTNANNEISANQTQAIANINEAKESATTQINTNQTQAIANINEAKESATTQINTNQTQAITNINEAKTTANNEISANQTQAINHITQEKTKATIEIIEAKKTDHYQNIDFFEIE
ncbi:hypothetical protein ACOWLR_07450 [Helicobacter pylori]